MRLSSGSIWDELFWFGKKLCNAVYVDDVVAAMLLAATRDEAVSDTFLVFREKPVTGFSWRL